MTYEIKDGEAGVGDYVMSTEGTLTGLIYRIEKIERSNTPTWSNIMRAHVHYNVYKLKPVLNLAIAADQNYAGKKKKFTRVTGYGGNLRLLNVLDLCQMRQNIDMLIVSLAKKYDDNTKEDKT